MILSTSTTSSDVMSDSSSSTMAESPVTPKEPLSSRFVEKSVSFASRTEIIPYTPSYDDHNDDETDCGGYYNPWYSRSEYKAFRQEYIESAKQVARWNRQHKKKKQRATTSRRMQECINDHHQNEDPSTSLLEAFQACCAAATSTESYATSSLYHYDLEEDFSASSMTEDETESSSSSTMGDDDSGEDSSITEDRLLERLFQSNPPLVLPDSSVVGLERMAARSIALDKQRRRKQLLQQTKALTNNKQKKRNNNDNSEEEEAARLLQRACESISRPSRLFARHLAQAAAQAA